MNYYLENIDEELTELLFEEVENQTISYLTFIKLTTHDSVSEISPIRYTLRNQILLINVIKISRTKISFDFSFTEVHKQFLMKLVNTISSYIEYNLKIRGNAYYNVYNIYFTIDIGSKEKCELFFKNMFTNS